MRAAEQYGGMNLARHWLTFGEPKTRVRKIGRLLQSRSRVRAPFHDRDQRRQEAAPLLFSIVVALEELSIFRRIAVRCLDFTPCLSLIEDSLDEIRQLIPAFGAWTQAELCGFDLSSREVELWIALAAACLKDLEQCRQEPISQVSALSANLSDPLHGLLEKTDLTAREDVASMFCSARHIFQTERKRLKSSLPAGFLPGVLMLVEGPTEAHLIPKFASLLGEGLSEAGIHLISSGGANQVVKRFMQWKELVDIPIVCVLDGDARHAIEHVAENRRSQDYLVVFAQGEIEDSFELRYFVELLNRYLESLDGVSDPTLVGSSRITALDFNEGSARRHVLKRLWKKRGLGEFDKVDFARFVAGQLNDSSKVPVEISKMMCSLRERTRTDANGGRS